jgi:hypothetical protein
MYWILIQLLEAKIINKAMKDLFKKMYEIEFGKRL